MRGEALATSDRMTVAMWLELQTNLIEGLPDEFDVDLVSASNAIGGRRIVIGSATSADPAVTIYSAFRAPWLEVCSQKAVPLKFTPGNQPIVDLVNEILLTVDS